MGCCGSRPNRREAYQPSQSNTQLTTQPQIQPQIRPQVQESPIKKNPQPQPAQQSQGESLFYRQRPSYTQKQPQRSTCQPPKYQERQVSQPNYTQQTSQRYPQQLPPVQERQVSQPRTQQCYTSQALPQVQERQLIQAQRPEPIFQQGVALLKQDKYEQALEKFIQVQKISPQFPSIEESIFLCFVYLKIQEIYQEGKQLFQRGDFEEALKRFEYIENSLKDNYKDVPKYIDACRQGIWKRSLQMLFIHLQVTEAMEEMQRMQRFFQMMAFLHEREQPKPQNLDKKPNYNDTNLDCVKVYSDCFKEKQCQLRNNSTPFRHKSCGTIAYFHASGQVSCEAKCQQYQIKEACFLCSGQWIRKIQSQSDIQQCEMIQDEQWLAKFVEHCLVKGNYTEGQQWNFREKITRGAYLQFLQK